MWTPERCGGSDPLSIKHNLMLLMNVKKSSLPFVFQIFQMWSSKEFFMGYFSLTCSPGRNPTRLEGAEASVSANGEEIDISAKLTEATRHNSSS